MIIIYNFITLCKYLVNYIIGNNDTYCLEFEHIKDDDYEIECGCNLCNTQEKIFFFLTRSLKCKKV